MPRQYFFWKYFNTIIVLYCIIVQKNPIFVQLSPIQCTYSNIFIRFFKFFPANTNIYQNSYRVTGANCAVEIALSGRQCSLLCLFAPFPHGYTVSRGVPDNCTFEITLLQAIMLTLMLVCAFFPRKYKSILRGFYNMVPFRAIRHKLHFWPNNRRKRQLFVFCLFIPFPHGYTVSRGVPVFSLAMT